MNKIENNNKNYRNEQIAGIAQTINNLCNIMEENLIEEGKKRTEYLNKNEVYYEIQARGICYCSSYEEWIAIWAEETFEEAVNQLYWFTEKYRYPVSLYYFRLKKIVLLKTENKEKPNRIEKKAVFQNLNNNKNLIKKTELKRITYRCKFIGLVDMSKCSHYWSKYGYTMYISLVIPIDFQTKEEAENSFFSLRFESDKNDEVVLKIYDNCYNVISTIHWEDKEKYNYSQSSNINDVINATPITSSDITWTNLFETHIQIVDELYCEPFRYTNSQNEEHIDCYKKIDLFAREIKDFIEPENEELTDCPEKINLFAQEFKDSIETEKDDIDDTTCTIENLFD